MARMSKLTDPGALQRVGLEVFHTWRFGGGRRQVLSLGHVDRATRSYTGFSMNRMHKKTSRPCTHSSLSSRSSMLGPNNHIMRVVATTELGAIDAILVCRHWVIVASLWRGLSCFIELTNVIRANLEPVCKYGRFRCKLGVGTCRARLRARSIHAKLLKVLVGKG